MTHKIDEETLNCNLVYCIDEYVRLIEHRAMLKEWWFEGKTLEQISKDHHICLTSTKDVIYGIGDKILLRASEMSKSHKSREPAFVWIIRSIQAFSRQPTTSASK